MEPRIEPDSNRFAALADAETVPAGTQELEEVRDIRERSSHVGDLGRVPETIVDALEEDLGWRDRQAKNPGPRRRQRIRGEGSDLGTPVHDLTLIDSSDDDAPFVVNRRSAASVERGPETEGEAQEDFSQAENIQPVRRLGRRLVLVPQSTGTPRSVQDRSDFTATVVDESTVGIHNDSPERRLVDAFEFDLTRCDSSSEDSLSDTASCTQFVPRRRLSLVWNVERSEPQAERIEERPVQWVRETRVAWGLIRDLARRIGVVQPEDPIPRAIRQQRWSPHQRAVDVGCRRRRRYQSSSGLVGGKVEIV